MYTYKFILPAGIIYFLLFILPTIVSFFFSFTRWDLFEWEFIGLDNFKTFLTESSLNIGFRNTLIFAGVTSVLKVVVGLLLGAFLSSKLIKFRDFFRSVVFFPTLISTVAVGVIFKSMMHPSEGIINTTLSQFGITGPDWLTNPDIAILTVALVEIWKGVGIATVIFIAAMMSIPNDYYESIEIDGGNAFRKFWNITLPLSLPAINTVIILSLTDGLRTFELVWTMTEGGPGFSSDVIASIIYKQYQMGFLGLSTAGNVILFILVALIAFPLYNLLKKKEAEL